MIDVLPRLHPRISRDLVEQAIERYRRLTTADEVDAELRADAYDQLEELAFYLSAEQCDLINKLELAYQDGQLANGGFKIERSPFKPDPTLDESYFA